MQFDTRELDYQAQQNPLTIDNAPASSLGESFSLAVQSTLAVDNTNSEFKYFQKQLETNIPELAKKSPENAEWISSFGERMDNPEYWVVRKLINNGDITFNEKSNQYVGKTAHGKAQLERHYDKVSDLFKYNQIASQFGGMTYEQMKEASKKSAYEDWSRAEKRMDATEGFWSGVAEFGGMAWGALQDPVQVATLFMGGPVVKTGEGIGAIAATAGRAALQEMKIAAVAEVPVQMQAYNWKNDIGIKWELRDAILSGAASIGVAGLVRAGGSAIMDVSTDGLKKMRERAIAKGDAEEVELITEYERYTETALNKNIEDHIDAEAMAYHQAVNGEPIYVEDIVTRSGDFTAQGQRVNEVANKPTINDTLREITPDDSATLYHTGMKPVYTEAPATEVVAKVVSEHPTITAPDTKPLRESGIDIEENTLEAYKAQEVDTWLKERGEEDIMIPETKINEKGDRVTEFKSFNESMARINKDIEYFDALMECAR